MTDPTLADIYAQAAANGSMLSQINTKLDQIIARQQLAAATSSIGVPDTLTLAEAMKIAGENGWEAVTNLTTAPATVSFWHEHLPGMGKVLVKTSNLSL